MSSPLMSSLPTLKRWPSAIETVHDQAVLLGHHHRLAHLDPQVARVGVELLDAAQVLDEERLRVGARVVEPGGRERPEAPGPGLEAGAQLAVAELLVADEVDRAQLELPALVDVEVDADRGLAERLDPVADLGEVVALGPVERRDPLAILEEQRIVEGGAGRERQDVADLVAVDRLVARDRDLAHDRVLLDVDDHPPPLGRLLREDPDVPEEAERLHLAHVPRDLGRAVARAGLGAHAREDRVRLDPAIAAHAHRRDAIGRRLLASPGHAAARRARS